MTVGLSRATVIDTACELFAERGYRGTSMKDIAEALGVRASSLYNHVTSKQDILFAIMDKAMDRALDAQAEALAGVADVSGQLRAATESLVLDFLRNPAEVTVCNTEVRSLDPANRAAIVAKRDRYAACVRAIIAEGHVRLAETLAERIATACFEDRRVRTVRVRVEKLQALKAAESAGVEIERLR